MIKLVTQNSYFEKKPNKFRWVELKNTHQLYGCTQNLHMGVH
jgi:hypothetical protein